MYTFYFGLQILPVLKMHNSIECLEHKVGKYILPAHDKGHN